MKIQIYFKQGAPNIFYNRYAHGPKEIEDFQVENGCLVIEPKEDRADIINMNIVLGYELSK